MDAIPPFPDSQSAAVGRAVRFGFAAIVLGMSYPNIRLALGLHQFGVIFRDMLGSRGVSPIANLVIQAQPSLIAVSILIPIVAVALIFAGRLTRSIYTSGALVLAVFFQLFFTWQAMSAPFFEIIRGMGATPP